MGEASNLGGSRSAATATRSHHQDHAGTKQGDATTQRRDRDRTRRAEQLSGEQEEHCARRGHVACGPSRNRSATPTVTDVCREVVREASERRNEQCPPECLHCSDLRNRPNAQVQLQASSIGAPCKARRNPQIDCQLQRPSGRMLVMARRAYPALASALVVEQRRPIQYSRSQTVCA